MSSGVAATSNVSPEGPYNLKQPPLHASRVTRLWNHQLITGAISPLSIDRATGSQHHMLNLPMPGRDRLKHCRRCLMVHFAIVPNLVHRLPGTSLRGEVHYDFHFGEHGVDGRHIPYICPNEFAVAPLLQPFDRFRSNIAMHLLAETVDDVNFTTLRGQGLDEP